MRQGHRRTIPAKAVALPTPRNRVPSPARGHPARYGCQPWGWGPPPRGHHSSRKVTAGSRAVYFLMVVLALAAVLYSLAPQPRRSAPRPNRFIAQCFTGRTPLASEAMMTRQTVDVPSGKYLRTFSLRPAILVAVSRTDACLGPSGVPPAVEKPQSLGGMRTSGNVSRPSSALPFIGARDLRRCGKNAGCCDRPTGGTDPGLSCGAHRE